MKYTRHGMFFIFLIVFVGAYVNKYQGIHLSVLTINVKRANGKIMHRFPNYGDGTRDGCIVQPEMRLDLQIDKNGALKGVVSDVSSGKGLNGASIMIRNSLRHFLINDR